MRKTVLHMQKTLRKGSFYLSSLPSMVDCRRHGVGRAKKKTRNENCAKERENKIKRMQNDDDAYEDCNYELSARELQFHLSQSTFAISL